MADSTQKGSLLQGGQLYRAKDLSPRKTSSRGNLGVRGGDWCWTAFPVWFFLSYNVIQKGGAVGRQGKYLCKKTTL